MRDPYPVPRSASPPGASSFRKQAVSSPGGDRMAVILEGNEKLVAEAIVAAVGRGLAVMLGPTRDRGAIGVHAWYGDRHWKDYVANAEELAEVLEGLRDFKPAQPGPTPISPLKVANSRS
jgi:hypothetical protein